MILILSPKKKKNDKYIFLNLERNQWGVIFMSTEKKTTEPSSWAWCHSYESREKYILHSPLEFMQGCT